MKFFMNDFRFKKKFGQNFLVDKNIVEKIASDIDILPNSLVIEIGCGDGKLTRVLCDKFDKVIGYEIDLEVKKNLFDNLRDFDNFEIIFDDFLKRDVISDIENVDYDNLYIVANLPYYITTPIIEKIVNLDLKFKLMRIMVQKEVAERICSSPGGKEYGAVTIAVNYYAEPAMICDVSRDLFVPAPNVDSAVLKLSVREKPPVCVNDEKRFFALVKAAFAQRRKTLLNALKNSGMFGDAGKISGAISAMGFDPKIRGERLSIEDFAKLSELL